MRISVVLSHLPRLSETFIAAQIHQLSGVKQVVHRIAGLPAVGECVVRPKSRGVRAIRKISRWARRVGWDDEVTHSYVTAFKMAKVDVALAQYGPTGVGVMEACRRLNLPLVVHFHGFDASKCDVLVSMGDRYRQLFEYASAVIGVSTTMVNKLAELGCPRQKLCYLPYGVDCDVFGQSASCPSLQHFVAVGRFVEKKAPHLTILAFAKVLERHPNATLTMIGDGPLLNACCDLVVALGIKESVKLLGGQDHSVVASEMRSALAFIQHSIEAADGDSEGTPVAILEAGAAGLPVVSTRHAGIADVVIDGGTGLLVEERDIDGMAHQMLRLLANPTLACELGRRAAGHVREYFTVQKSVARLSRVLVAAARGERMDVVKREIEAELLSVNELAV